MMNQEIKSTLKKIPGLRALVLWARRRIGANKTRRLLKHLYPLLTDKELIRFGPTRDGGYLIPNDLEGIQACFSPGVSDVSGFEKDCADFGMQVFLADGSVDGPADEHELFHFTKKFIGGARRDGFITLDDWVSSSVEDGTSDLMLQMDVEGYEYEVFSAASEPLIKRFRIIVVEFHRLDGLLAAECKQISDTFEKILKTHVCVHVHPNNCCGIFEYENMAIPRVMEFTFLRKDRINHFSYQTTFPHPLDCDNLPKPPLVLPQCWYSPRMMTTDEKSKIRVTLTPS